MPSQLLEHAQLVAAFALKAPGREIGYDVAGHLGFLADRLCLQRHNFPMVTDRRMAVMGMGVDCGVMRTVFDGFNPVVRGEPMFSEVGTFACRLSDHIMVEDLDLHSVATTSIVDEIWSAYGSLRIEDLASAMSDAAVFPEIAAAGHGDDITIMDMLHALGFEDAAEIAQHIEDHERMDRLLSVLAPMRHT